MIVAWLVPPLALLAGWLIWSRLPPARDEQDDRYETAFAAVLCGGLAVGFLALLLAQIGHLRPSWLVLALAAVSAACWLLPRRSPPRDERSVATLAALVAVTVGTAVILAPASEELLGGRDQGVYANTALWLAQTGTVRVHSEALASVTTEARLVFASGVLLPGFYLGNVSEGQVYPQFLHLHPVYMAIGYWLGGLRGLFLVPPLYGVLSHLALFFFARRLIGLGPALVAVLVLGLNLAQVWTLRNPYSESAIQPFVLALLWTLGRGGATGGLRWGILGGLVLGACFQIRIDAPLLMVALLPAFAVIIASAPRPQTWITHALVPLTLVTAAWAALHGWVFSLPYVRALARFSKSLWQASGALLALLVIVVVVRPRARRLMDWIYRHGWWFWAVIAAGIVAAFIAGLWIRPHLEPYTTGRMGRYYDEETLVRVGWYVSTPGLVLALGGVLVGLHRWLVGRRTEWAPFLAVFMAFSLLYLWDPKVSPDHPWAMRRFVPVVLPGIALAIAAMAAWLWQWRGPGWTATRAAALLAVGVVAVHQARMTLPFWNLREKGGSAAVVEEIARHVPPHSLVLYTRGIESWIATPLAFQWQRSVLPVAPRGRRTPNIEERREQFERQVKRWLQEGRDVLYLTRHEGESAFLVPDLRWEQIGVFELRADTAGIHLTQPPRRPGITRAEYRLLRIRPGPLEPPPCTSLALELGDPVPGVTRGFYQSERSQHGRFRWTRPEAMLLLPTCDRRGGPPAALRLRAACGRRVADEDDCRVEVAINGEPAGTLRLGREWGDHEIAVPPPAVSDPTGAIEVALRGPSHEPVGGGRRRDKRVLSFQLMRVNVVGPAEP